MNKNTKLLVKNKNTQLNLIKSNKNDWISRLNCSPNPIAQRFVTDCP